MANFVAPVVKYLNLTKRKTQITSTTRFFVLILPQIRKHQFDTMAITPITPYVQPDSKCKMWISK